MILIRLVSFCSWYLLVFGAATATDVTESFVRGEEDGNDPEKESRIVGGDVVSPGEYPWFASVDRSISESSCGGGKLWLTEIRDVAHHFSS